MLGKCTIEMGMVITTILDTDMCMVTAKRKSGLERRGKCIGILVHTPLSPRHHREVDADAYTQVLQLGTMVHPLVIGLSLSISIMPGSEFGMRLLHHR